ncbi:HAD family hydrolase [Pseudoroseicyclus tamaricis]|uniref:HAD family hydrolase n=1 Tax=Pseudoroseicyclus tamaricis TaxID=2705421 RepID=UPI001F324F6E|nr:HAD family hydrolase [Pseudoroseicyclus tamaricis]
MRDTNRVFAFDADDTLWHNEKFFRLTQERFAGLLADHAEVETLGAKLLAAERRNLGHYGFGIKGFTLSMIETALEVTDRQVPGAVIAEILAAGQEMLRHPIELLPGAEEAVAALAERGRVILITKGDLLDQERKLAQSGLGDAFDAVEIVSDKTEATYARLFAGSTFALMAGNSMKSDILPALAAGAHGVHVPHETTWALEEAEDPAAGPRFHRIATLEALPELVDGLLGA